MDLTIYVGLALLLAIFLNVIGIKQSAALFVSPEAFQVIFGGLIAATLIQNPWKQLKELASKAKILFSNNKLNYREDTLLLLRLSKKIHTEGRNSLESEITSIKDPFMSHAMQMVMDKVDPAQIKALLKEMIEHSESRHEQGIYYFEQLAKLSPGFALVGTLIGLVKLLSNLSDPKTIGPHMGTALVSTFYGVAMSNLVFLPLASRLRVASYNERIHKEMLIEGIIAIANDELPYLVRDKIYMIVTEKDRKFLKAQETE
ncbi:MAG: motility protein A [Candidatus Margulisiibacteriota bacterium]